MPIQLLAGMCPALTSEILMQLTSKGIKQVIDFVSMDPERITALCGLPFKKVLSIRRVLLAQYSAFPVNGLDLYNEALSTLAVLSTSCSNLDEILDCGVYTGEVTEFVGVSVSGKTQLCQSLTIQVAGELEQNVVYIDTTGGWSVKRAADITRTRFPQKQVSSVLSRIQLCQCYDIKELEECLEQLQKSLHNQPDCFYSSLKLVVVDSVSAVLGSCFVSGTYVEGCSLLQSIGRRLNALAKDFAIAVIITNDMVSAASTTSTEFYSMKPALGRCWTFVPSVRVVLEPDKEPCQLWECKYADKSCSLFEPTIKAIVEKSVRSPRQSTLLKITNAGVANGT